jgi:hypothetical protein
MSAQKLATAYSRNGGVITNVDGTTRIMTRHEVSKARRFIARTGIRIQWQTTQKRLRVQAAANLDAMQSVARASGLAI